jgi:hypothetical protein
MDGPIGQYLHELAVLATHRHHQLGHAAATERPVWATTVLGPPPDDPAQRQGWIRDAGLVGAYRELQTIPQDVSSIGAAPSREQVLHRVMWRHASTALEHHQPEDSNPGQKADYRRASDGSLREWVAHWQRAQTWAPPFVADQLREAHILAQECHRDATLAHAQLANLAPGAAEHATSSARATRAAQIAEQATQHTHQLEQAHHERYSWAHNTRHLQEHARAAAEELTRRGVDLHPGTTPPAHATPSRPTATEGRPAAHDGQPIGIVPHTAERRGPKQPREADSDIARIHQQTRELLAATAQHIHHTTHRYPCGAGATVHDTDPLDTGTQQPQAGHEPRRALDPHTADRTSGYTRDHQHHHDHDYEQGLDH